MSIWLSVLSHRALALWAVGTAGVTAWFGTGFVVRTAARELLVPGSTTAGHHQIELACEACHQEPFGGPEAMQVACLACHGAELKQANDSHPEAKFTDPRNASLVAVLDARLCVTCHVEHAPERTRAMGVTQPVDFCVHCHAGIADERSSHRDLPFDGCAATGCHNFHDNRALYEDFLLKHAEGPATRSSELPVRVPSGKGQPLTRRSVASFLQEHRLEESEVEAWERSAHARAQVGCSDCHDQSGRFVARPELTVCRSCHQDEVAGWQAGRHGMSTAQELPPLLARNARQPMKADAGDRSADCNACHAGHGYDTRLAAVDACVGCHDDRHTRAYAASRHAALQRDETAGRAPPGSGVSCATCHLPRVQERDGRVHVVHNQNDNLRPAEKMLRSVCLSCHSLRFSMDALADRDLVVDNFSRIPARQVESIDMAVARSSSAARSE